MNPSFPQPSPAEVDAYWAAAAAEVPRDPRPVERRPFSCTQKDIQYDHHVKTEWLLFHGVDGMPFWCVWQRSSNRGVSKTLVHLPGYGTEVSLHPFFCHEGYHVLHVNPRGYCGPDGIGNPEWRRPDGMPDVLIHNLHKPDEYGYRYWIQDGLIAVRWLLHQMEPGAAELGVLKNPLGFYGTSQGGGGALALASVAREFGPGVAGAVAADVPFLTGFSLVYPREERGSYTFALTVLDVETNEEHRRQIVRSLGFIDSMNHAHRLQCPVLLTAAEADASCPPDTIHALYTKLPATRSITLLARQGHEHTFAFLRLAHAWFDLFL